MKNGCLRSGPRLGIRGTADQFCTVPSFERCHHYPRCADAQPEEHLLRDSPREADGDQRSVGVGQSSLAFDTIYAEGSGAMSSRCRPMRGSSLSALRSRRGRDRRAGAAIAIKQKNTTAIRVRRWPRRPRSTTTCAFSTPCGEVHCVTCDGLVKRDSIDEVAEATLALARERGSMHCSRCAAKRRRLKRPRRLSAWQAGDQSRAKAGQKPLPSRRSARL